MPSATNLVRIAAGSAIIWIAGTFSLARAIATRTPPVSSATLSASFNRCDDNVVPLAFARSRNMD